MNSHLNYHAVKIKAPYFRKSGGSYLQRYLIPDFIARFQQDLKDGSLGNALSTAWQHEDRFNKHDNSLVLRLPMHKTFYVISCEVNCNRLGEPALAPEKITSAGFVIRRVVDGKEQSWMIENDEPVGWEESSTGLRDPDAHRHTCRDGSLHAREDMPTYTGEKTHPLHKETSYDEDGKRHTILYGYLPLGGTFVQSSEKADSPFDDASLSEFSEQASKHLPWPYGLRNGRRRYWLDRHTRPVTSGRPDKEFFELLRLLVNRYHLGEGEIQENEKLKDLAESINFYVHDNDMGDHYSDQSKGNFEHLSRYSFYHWLASCFSQEENPIAAWVAAQEKAMSDTGLSMDDYSFTDLPARYGQGLLNLSLYITASEAREFRTLLDQRVLDNALSLAKEIPIPKFQQGENDRYQIVPFVRAKDDFDKERIYWCEASVRSELFRVAAPFDPNASRPSAIPMPSLSDLRSGLAKGASMITPPDTFNLLNALNLKKGASEDVLPKDEPGGIGIQWICSFSLPVITLVAMILLMIMISLLNIIFFWLPWVKICLPFPKFK